MKNRFGFRDIELFPKLDKVRRYQLQCALFLTSVPMACSAILMGLLYCFAQLNLYFLENGGLIISAEIRQAYHDQVRLELFDVLLYLGMLYVLTFVASFVTMVWAISPFVNAERALKNLLNSKSSNAEIQWMSECPELLRATQCLALRLKDPKSSLDAVEEPKYSFNFRYFSKFVLVFFGVSTATGCVLGIVLNTVYLKIVNLAITLVGMNHRGYYFLAQEELLNIGVTVMTAASGLIFCVIGLYVTSYMSNMSFVFARAIKLQHFPLKLRDSDIYHGLADTISEVAARAGLSKKS